jgi:hypothetical protein
MAAISPVSRASIIASPLLPIGIGYTPYPVTTSLIELASYIRG